MAHLSPSVIFSPSIARQQLATAKDWNYIDGWLATKLNGKPAPPFERNNDTLKALLALATLNETADDNRELLAKVEAKALQELQELQAKETTDTDAETLKALEENLSREGHAGLDALASTGVILNQPFADVEQLARKIVNLHATSFDLEQASDRITLLHKHLSLKLEQINGLLQELRSDAYQPPTELSKQTLDFQRKAKVLAAKLPELRDRAASLSAAAGTPKPSVQDIRLEEDKYREQMARVKELETQVKGFHGLPHDTDLARLDLEELRVELKELSRQRDRIFEGLVERESPKKFKS